MKYQNKKKTKTRSMFYALRSMKWGATLIELIIYMGILAVVLVVLTQLFGSAVDVRRESEATSYTMTDSRYIYNRFLYDIGNADSIVTPTNLGDVGASLQYMKSGITHTYNLSDTNLLLDGIRLNSFGTSISNLSFHRLGNPGGKNTIRFSYTVTSKVRKNSGFETKTITSTMGMR